MGQATLSGLSRMHFFLKWFHYPLTAIAWTKPDGILILMTYSFLTLYSRCFQPRDLEMFRPRLAAQQCQLHLRSTITSGRRAGADRSRRLVIARAYMKSWTPRFLCEALWLARICLDVDCRRVCENDIWIEIKSGSKKTSSMKTCALGAALSF
jgi:hypothetical protein